MKSIIDWNFFPFFWKTNLQNWGQFSSQWKLRLYFFLLKRSKTLTKIKNRDWLAPTVLCIAFYNPYSKLSLAPFGRHSMPAAIDEIRTYDQSGQSSHAVLDQITIWSCSNSIMKWKLVYLTWLSCRLCQVKLGTEENALSCRYKMNLYKLFSRIPASKWSKIMLLDEFFVSF